MRLLLAIGLILASAPAVAAAPQPQEDKLVCRYQEGADLGSHISRAKKVCMRASEWKELEAINEQTQRRLQERGPGTRRTDQATMGPGA
jgi:hypothetical protein